MSTWIDIKEQDDVEYDSLPMTEDTIDILYSSDKFGNNYISVPVRFIIKVLRDNGYEVE